MVCSNSADNLYSHNRNGSTFIIERQPLFLRIWCLYSNFITNFDTVYSIKEFVGVSVLPDALFYKLFILVRVIGITICSNEPTACYCSILIKSLQIKTKVNRYRFKPIVNIASICQFRIEHLSDFWIPTKYLAYLIIHSESADHSFNRTIPLGLITVIKFICHRLIEFILVNIILFGIHEPQICAYIVSVLIMLFPCSVIVLIAKFLSGIHKFGHSVWKFKAFIIKSAEHFTNSIIISLCEFKYHTPRICITWT